MDKVTGSLTVFFEAPFWVGVFERTENGKLSVVKVVFGAEPKDSEIYAFILAKYDGLDFSPAVAVLVREKRKTPKRIQREVKKQLKTPGIGTKSQQALQRQREQSKGEQKQKRRQRQEAEAQRNFELKQQKKKAKHRGR
ncbi:MAG: YjdF family protein [Christensenella sp.]|uniref:YjdF family protein n=1 Tax=Christensenella sp. TaxID=1935934 RepID=UPI002B20BB07|nr:YjdF family protein [Christensenella sp.]MEA5003377.1 YjdF family protein [Christensenella sp.]